MFLVVEVIQCFQLGGSDSMFLVLEVIQLFLVVEVIQCF